MPDIKKVIVVGLDGLEPRIVEPMMERGELPNLARLRDAGGYARIATTWPAQTPVAWSSAATGVNPGGHGVYDFIARDPDTYLPDLSFNAYESRGPFLPPAVVNRRRGTPVWEHLSRAGVPAVVLRWPCTYPPEPITGRMLSGMGVPDLLGSQGMGTFLTSREDVHPGRSERVLRVRPDGNGGFRVRLTAPHPGRAGKEPGVELAFEPDRAGRAVLLRSPGDPPESRLSEGRWSEWLSLNFQAGPLQAVRGTIRVLLVRLEPDFEVYVSPINFDPASPAFPLSSPPDYAAQLERAVGTFYTTGMIEDYNGLINGRFDEAAFLDQCGRAMWEREAMFFHELERTDEGLIFCLFDTPDRIQHMLWRFREPDHPAHVPDRARELAHVIDEQYHRCDEIVGRALRHADDRTLVIALSDHGFTTFRRGVNLNTWLLQNGFLALRPGAEPGAAADLLRDVDWGRTRAYALGLGSIYLNLRGRERDGIVDSQDADALAASIARGLSELRDPATGRTAIRSVARRPHVYRGACAAEAPDLVAGCGRGYRVSWATGLGGITAHVFEDNVQPWGGDHIIDPELVPGIILMNRAFRTRGPRLVDLAPTILAALGVPPDPVMDGASLLP